MDTGTDFIQPEFLDILFFQQKNLVIFPYVDLKHLHSLEIFAVGHNIIDLESTALNDLKGMIELTNNSYSQTPSLFLIYNTDKDKIKEVMTMEDVRCIINSSDNVQDLVNGANYIFYNKKSKQFINYTPNNSRLKFETHLINTSPNQVVLQDKIQKIKMAATQIFTEYVETSKLDSVQDILMDYDPQHWNKIINFVRLYFKIEIPDIDIKTFRPKKPIRSSRNTSSQKSISKPSTPKGKDFSEEYEILVSTNNVIGKEFVQLLHEYRRDNVNPRNLETEQLYNPQKVYNYLRNNHWKSGISKRFLIDWIQMPHTRRSLTDEDLEDFNKIFEALDIPEDIIFETISDNEDSYVIEEDDSTNPVKTQNKSLPDKNNTPIPSIENFSEFKSWILKRMASVEKLLGIE